MSPDDLSYFRKRAMQEQIAGQKAVCRAARLRHDELAAMYRFRVAMLSKDFALESWPFSMNVEETVA